MFKEGIHVFIIVAGMAAIAAGRVPGLRVNRASIALIVAVALIVSGAIPLDAAYRAVDLGTIVLLFSMMILVASLRISGLFDLVAARLSGLAGSPATFLAAIVAAAGVLSALFLNDTMCLVLGPVVAETCIRARRDPVPYLVATATAANVGSAATIIGNPQNMLIGATSGIPFTQFVLRAGPPAMLGLLACWLVIVTVFPKEFGSRARRIVAARNAASVAPLGTSVIDRHMARKSLIASAAMLAGFLAGVPVAIAALVPAAFLLWSRRVESDRLLSGVDFNLLVFFCGLFIITAAAARTVAFTVLSRTILADVAASPWKFSAVTAVISNIISNVPAVMVLSPSAAATADPGSAWLVLALASTFAGNLTLLGSVANLIVAEGAASRGVKLGFLSYLTAGVPITVATIAIGTFWLGLTA